MCLLLFCSMFALDFIRLVTAASLKMTHLCRFAHELLCGLMDLWACTSRWLSLQQRLQFGRLLNLCKRKRCLVKNPNPLRIRHLHGKHRLLTFTYAVCFMALPQHALKVHPLSPACLITPVCRMVPVPACLPRGLSCIPSTTFCPPLPLHQGPLEAIMQCELWFKRRHQCEFRQKDGFVDRRKRTRRNVLQMSFNSSPLMPKGLNIFLTQAKQRQHQTTSHRGNSDNDGALGMAFDLSLEDSLRTQDQTVEASFRGHALPAGCKQCLREVLPSPEFYSSPDFDTPSADAVVQPNLFLGVQEGIPPTKTQDFYSVHFPFCLQMLVSSLLNNCASSTRKPESGCCCLSPVR